MVEKSRAPGLSWYMQRLTALLLVVGLVGHFIVLHYTKLYQAKTSLAADSTAERFGSSPMLWLLFDGMILVAAMYHAMNGVYNIVSDYSPSPAVRRGLAWLLWVVGLAGSLVGLLLLGRFIAMGN